LGGDGVVLVLKRVAKKKPLSGTEPEKKKLSVPQGKIQLMTGDPLNTGGMCPANKETL